MALKLANEIVKGIVRESLSIPGLVRAMIHNNRYLLQALFNNNSETGI